jgi:hypothetical protein
MINECGGIGGTRIDEENRSTRGKRTPVILLPPQLPYVVT